MKIYFLILALFFFNSIEICLFGQEVVGKDLEFSSTHEINNFPEDSLSTRSVILANIPNPSFESMSNCPLISGQMNYVDFWGQGGPGTSDYFSQFCGYLTIGIPDVPQLPFPDGNSYTGFFSTSLSNEYIGVCLTAPFLAGTTYSIDFFTAQGLAVSSTVLNIGLFGTPNCADLPWSGTTDCPVGINGWQTLGNVIVNYTANDWQSTQILFTPIVDINAIAIGPSCGNPSSSLSGYYYLDGLTPSCVTPLPVELVNFRFDCITSQLKWTTLSERENDYFTVERSCNGQDFQVVSIVNGIGNSSTETNYKLDVYNNDCIEDATYYRLSQTDYNGVIEFLGVITGNCGLDELEILYSSNEITVNFDSSLNLKLYNVQGQIVFEDTKFNGGIWKYSTGDLAVGAYILVATPNNGAFSEFTKIIKF